MGKVGKNHGQSAHAFQQKRDASGKFTRGSGVEVAPEASAGREIPSAAELAPEDSTGREIPSASERALRAITQGEMRSGSGVVAKKTMVGATASSSLSPEHNVGLKTPKQKVNKGMEKKLRAEEQIKLDARVARVTEWLMLFQESPKEKAPVEDFF